MDRTLASQDGRRGLVESDMHDYYVSLSNGALIYAYAANEQDAKRSINVPVGLTIVAAWRPVWLLQDEDDDA